MVELSILVCDDSELVRKQMIEVIRSVGIANTLEATNGEEAVKICHEAKPNLVFMDIIMPKKDGIAALKEITHNYPNIKVIMASSTTGQAHLKKALLLGAYTFIQKPISEESIRDIIDKYTNETMNKPPISK